MWVPLLPGRLPGLQAVSDRSGARLLIQMYPLLQICLFPRSFQGKLPRMFPFRTMHCHSSLEAFKLQGGQRGPWECAFMHWELVLDSKYSQSQSEIITQLQKSRDQKKGLLLMEGNFKVILNSLKSSGKSQEMGTKLALL